MLLLSLTLELLGPSPARAGSDIFGSLPGHLTSSTLAPAAGERFTVTLRLTPSSSERHLKIAFEAPRCAVLEEKSARYADVSLVAGREASFTTKARVIHTTPCKIVATVLQTDETNARTGWVYALVLNKAPPSASESTPGHDAAGRPTVDAVTH